jgi:hypothetical protein
MVFDDIEHVVTFGSGTPHGTEARIIVTLKCLPRV